MTIDNQDFAEAIDACHQYLYTPVRGFAYEEIIEVYISSDTPSIGFLDPSKDHEFYCGPSLSGDLALSLTYNMKFEKLSDAEMYAELVAEGRASIRVPVDPSAFEEHEETKKKAEEEDKT